LLKLSAAIAERLGLEESQNPELDELVKDVAPEKVLDRMGEAVKDDAEKRGD